MHIRVQIGGTYAIDLDAYVVRREFEGERLYRRDPDDATRYRLVLKMNDTTAANDRTDMLFQKTGFRDTPFRCPRW